MRGFLQGSGRRADRAVLLISTIVVLVLVVLTASEVVLAGQLRPYYQTSPRPTPTFTVTPVLATPTNTPAPNTPTNTPAPPTNTPVPNTPPEIITIIGPADPVGINDQPVTVEVRFSDADSGDTHTVTWDWGDGSPIDTQMGATSPAAQNHTYAAPGVYPVAVTVTDDAGASDDGVFEFIVIFDPAGGFVTGGGWYNSPSGAFTPDDATDADLTGRAHFGFVSKYEKGASVPSGNTHFQFRAGDLVFNSTSYEWLVINQNDRNAQFKGDGIIVGDDQVYRFMIWAGDDNPDTFRIKIWRDTPAGENRVYDNEGGSPLAGGSIAIHNGR